MRLLMKQTPKTGTSVSAVASQQRAGSSMRSLRAVPEVGGDGEQVHQLVVIDDLGQRGGGLATGHVEVGGSGRPRA